jgi:SAM-dependent methyltransferase
MSDPRTRLVGAGYDAMADTWEDWSSRIDDDPRGDWLEQLLAVLPPDPRIVELGCGNGTRETSELARRSRLTGVDLSKEQLRRARERVPQAEFVHGDITAVEFEPGSLDAVVAFYVLNHVPRELLPALFERIHLWLRPGGHLLATLGASDLPDWEGEWLGVPMFFSGHSRDVNLRLLGDAGLEVVQEEAVTIAEPEGNVTFHWVLVRR